MKVPPKRKGNYVRSLHLKERELCLNESPSEKEGKSGEVALVSMNS